MCGGSPDYVQENEYERELVDMAERRLAEYNELYVPLEYQQMADIERYRSDTYKQGSKDKSVNAARMSLPASATAGAGMDPGSGNMMLQSMGTEQQVGTASAMGAMAGLQSAEDMYAQGQADLVSVGRGQTGQAMNMTANMAQQQAGQIAAKKAAEQTASNAKMGAMGTIAGLGVGYAGDKMGWFGKTGAPTGGNYDANGMWVNDLI